jgi:hypothetical protein
MKEIKKTCTECYSEHPRITPLNGAKECLENHKQYICSKCGRIVCIDLGGERKARCFFPFKTKEMAILYLKCAEIITNSCCSIYELTDKKGVKRYKIFVTETELNNYLKKNKDKKCNKPAVYIGKEYKPVLEEQVRYLTKTEIKKSMSEREKMEVV